MPLGVSAAAVIAVINMEMFNYPVARVHIAPVIAVILNSSTASHHSVHHPFPLSLSFIHPPSITLTSSLLEKKITGKVTLN